METQKKQQSGFEQEVFSSEAQAINKRELAQNLLWFAVVLGTIFAFVKFVGFENIQGKVQALGAFGPVLLVLMKASTLVFAPLGGAPLYPITGAIYGFWEGFLLMMLGDFIGSTTSFFISRRFGKSIAEYFLSKPGMRAAEVVLKYLGTKKGLIQARIMFAGFPEAVSYAAGLTNVPYIRFIIIHISIGIVPVAIGVALGNIIVQKANKIFAIGMTLLAGTATTIGGWWFYKQARKAENNQSQNHKLKSD